jgi:aminopeptidase
MIDLRTKKLAKIVVDYSLDVQHDENVIISGSTEAEPFIIALYEEILIKGGHPVLKVTLPGLTEIFYKVAKEHHLKKYPDITEYTVKHAQKYIGIDTEFNTRELTNSDPRKMATRALVTKPISDYISRNIKWVGVAYPCVALAQEADMSLSDYEDFVFGACLQDWGKFSKELEKIRDRFIAGKRVKLTGPGVDLEFDIKGDLAKIDDGHENMPGGEVFMAPNKTTLNGSIKFDYPSVRDGREVSDIRLEFKDGKVIKSTASKNENFLKEMLKVDKNSSYVGEFGIGCNPRIKKYTNNLLFDEKIEGTIHLALGEAFIDNGGGNDSAIHWDIMKDMDKGQIILDGKVVQDKGTWKI